MKENKINELNLKQIGADILEKINRSWQISNAKYFRDKCFFYTPSMFEGIGSYRRVFKEPLSEIFIGFGEAANPRVFSEIHTSFHAFKVFGLKESWNKRDLDLKGIVLSELRQAFIDYAKTKNYNFDNFFTGVITDAWLVNDVLVLEIPDSVFPVSYPNSRNILAPKDYWELRAHLTKKSSI